MRVTLIHGQSHRESSYHLGQILAKKIAQAEDIEEIFLPADFKEFCCGCANCFIKGEETCPHYQQVKQVLDKIDRAQTLIFTTPVYAMRTSGGMKTLLDHLSYQFMVHRPSELSFKRQAVVIATGAGGGMRSACKDISTSLFHWGTARTYTYKMASASTTWENVKEDKKKRAEMDLSGMAKTIIDRSFAPVPRVPVKLWFHLCRLVIPKMGNDCDMNYWRDKGWLDKRRPWPVIALGDRIKSGWEIVTSKLGELTKKKVASQEAVSKNLQK
ncbi:flavodoxin family protein [Ohessyouella blattaphilus]|uniref:NAD(P)H-dependent oxidoreductase n=1 Tax=Ohessyouella blattaphilus TaxID=2949333 RepID=A0ABT1EHQ5_9FIRM|nr:NAD(P)H-dependent oxidoreductase [Ohessyouella blattaphilus]MCP1110242.1 NAD(P)H-dependent oxidoreductase [Ohessyouella blattaphilus]MCR8563636.1 NAD(P)H-dependent oxidoreductase [Ohessyouella blattaphilus]